MDEREHRVSEGYVWTGDGRKVAACEQGGPVLNFGRDDKIVFVLDSICLCSTFRFDELERSACPLNRLRVKGLKPFQGSFPVRDCVIVSNLLSVLIQLKDFCAGLKKWIGN